MNQAIEIEAVEAPEAVSPPELRVLRREETSSLSGRSRIGYEICCNEAGTPFVRVVFNSGKGLFSSEAVPMELIEGLLAGASEERPITSADVQSKLYPSRSANCGGFAVAWMLNEKILSTAHGVRTAYKSMERAEFYSGIRAAMEAGVALDVSGKLGRQNPRLEPASTGNEVATATKKAAGKASGKVGSKSKKG